VLIGTIIFFIQYSIAHADTIYFKDGRIIETITCWEENGEIKYEKYGATVAVNKIDVLKVVHDSWEDIGHRYFNIGKYKKALNHFTKAIIDDPNNIELYINRAKCWHKLKNTDAKIKDLKKASELDPKNENLRAELNVLLKREKSKIKTQNSPVKSKIKNEGASKNRSNFRKYRDNSYYRKETDYERYNRHSSGPKLVKVHCWKCYGKGYVQSWHLEKSFEGYDSYGNPIRIDRKVHTKERCELCNGVGYNLKME
jgi:tetratricopeptide (TPR) repeat protein